MLFVMDALFVGRNGQVITQKKFGSCHGHMVKNTRKKRSYTNKKNRRAVQYESCGGKV